MSYFIEVHISNEKLKKTLKFRIIIEVSAVHKVTKISFNKKKKKPLQDFKEKDKKLKMSFEKKLLNKNDVPFITTL